MDVQNRVQELTAHLPNNSKRAKVRNNLTAFLSKLEEISPDTEKITETKEPYQNDNFDHVPVMTILQYNAREAARMARVTTLVRFTDESKPEPIVNGIDARGRYGYTALHRAVLDNDIAGVKNLLSKGARTDLVDRCGMTALQKARLEGYSKIVKILKRK